MRRIVMALGASAALVFAACGGDDDGEEDAGANGEGETVTASAEPEPSPSRTVEAPTPAGEDSIALIVVAPDVDTFQPTVAEFRELPTTTIGEFTGVSMAALAEIVGATPEMIVNMDGRLPGGNSGVIRYPLSEIAESVVFVVDESGHVALKSTTLPPEVQLTSVSAIAFAN